MFLKPLLCFYDKISIIMIGFFFFAERDKISKLFVEDRNSDSQSTEVSNCTCCPIFGLLYTLLKKSFTTSLFSVSFIKNKQN